MTKEILEELQSFNLDSIETLKFGVLSHSILNGSEVVLVDIGFFNKGLDLIIKEKNELFQQINTLKAAQ